MLTKNHHTYYLQNLIQIKFVLILFLYFFMFAEAVYTQGRIVEIYPNLPHVEYYGVYFFNPDTGFAVGEDGIIIKTTDGGINWLQKTSPTINNLWKINAFDYNNIFICGYNGTLLHSTDVGETWDIVNTNVTDHLLGLKILDQQIGWICGFDSVLFKTEDGGNTWTRKVTTFPGVYRDIDFYNNNIGYICSTTGFLVTEDGGNNWVSKIYGGLNTVEPLTESNVITGSPTGHILYSSDRGTTWIFTNVPLTSNIQSLEMVNDTLGYACSNFSNSHFVTKDGGLSWTENIERIGNSQIIFIDEDIGYGVGTNLTLTKTTDGGKAWRRLIINEGISDIAFIDENRGFMTSFMLYSFEDSYYHNKLFYSNNGGKNWKFSNGFSDSSIYHINSVTFIDDSNGFIGLPGGLIYKTTDEGVNWEKKDTLIITIGLETPPLNDFFFYSDIGWALISGYSGSRIKKTLNLGETWNLLDQTFNKKLNNIYFIDELNGWITGQGYFGKTTDGGYTWIQITSLNFSNYNDVFFSDLNTGWLTVDLNRTLLTIDGGLNWQLTSFKGGNFEIVDSNKIYITSNEALYYSSDRGSTWSMRLDSANSILLSSIPKINTGWGIINSTNIFQYEDTIYVPVELVLFECSVIGSRILLNWQTATELNNEGFAIEKSTDKINWSNIGFVEGNGTSSTVHYYEFEDNNAIQGQYSYRLKQMDYDGSYKYSEVIEISVSSAKEYSLSQNFPNPFNPNTIIEYQIPEETIVNISLYDIIGRKVKELINEKKQPGHYFVELRGGELSSGIYLYRIVTNSGYDASKKLILLK